MLLIQVRYELKHNLVALLAHNNTRTVLLEHLLVFMLSLHIETGIAAYGHHINHQIIILSLMIARYLEVGGSVRLIPDGALESLELAGCACGPNDVANQ
jgi:hypothetical protein